MNENEIEVKTWWCHNCKISFKQEKNLKSHQKNFHDTKLRRYVCKHCEKSFTTAYNFLQHHETIHISLPLPEKKDFIYSFTRNTRSGAYFGLFHEN